MTKLIDGLVNTGLCKGCYDKIEWKKKFHKYKPLTVPRKCNSCAQKTINKAYHVLCDGCAKTEKKCAKCCHVRAVIKDKTKEQKEREKALTARALENMNERERRSWQRKFENCPGRKDRPGPEHQLIVDAILESAGFNEKTLLAAGIEEDDDREVINADVDRLTSADYTAENNSIEEPDASEGLDGMLEENEAADMDALFSAAGEEVAETDPMDTDMGFEDSDEQIESGSLPVEDMDMGFGDSDEEIAEEEL